MLAVPAVSGPITVTLTARLDDITLAAAVRLLPPPPRISGIVNAESFTPALCPGAILSVFGERLGPPSGATAAGGDVPTTLGGTRILVNGLASPILYSSPSQVNAIIPFSAPGPSALLQVEYAASQSDPVVIDISDVSPAVVTLDGTGQGQAAALNQDGTTNLASNSAARGSIIVLFAVGLGRTSPPSLDGKIAVEVLPKPVAPVSVRIDGREATVIYAGAAPGMVSGAYQLNARIPQDAAPGTVPLVLSVGGVASQPGVTVAVY